MSDLAEFLNARLDEDEACMRVPVDHPHYPQCLAWPSSISDPCECGLPVRMLREVEAKRRIIARYEYCVKIAGEDQSSHPESGLADAAYELLTFTLPALAAVYSDKPGYDPEWSLSERP
jgi:Family of unknown function (DUF6221)